MNRYKDNTNNELLSLLDRYKSLTFPAQIELQKELINRDLIDNLHDLNSSITDKISDIKSMNYLSDIGFEMKDNEESIEITRTRKAIIIDLISIILGFILSFIGLLGFISLIGSFFTENEFNLFSLVMNIFQISLGILGFKILNGFKRFIDYLDFKLTIKNEIVTLEKRFDLKLTTLVQNVSHLSLDKQSDKLVLRLDDYDILGANPKNIIQKMTITELVDKLKTVANNS